ncbi:uncharacterized protein LOC123545282 [Mercenaria mercenaria]|uniref:uncharacterized protein LOC123545282 n=1 Tax=Mercenaria mercenaria TaxID=6596 RepID=UPI00234E9319|nr:uncharacterized protein LOC123545282 [Mercenaria mercenaria]
MKRSLKVGSCSCSSLGNIEDLLHCAPCPPPMISYEELRDHALNRSLILNDVCIIARRCNINGTDIVVDCPPVTPDCPASTTIHTYVAGYESGIVVPVVLPVVVIAIIIITIICVRKREKIKSLIRKNYMNKKSGTDKRSDPKSIEETTLSSGEVKVDEVKVPADTPVPTTDPEETTALVHVETEKTLESYVLAPGAVLEERKENNGNDLDNNESTLYGEGTKPIPLGIPVQENIKSFRKEKSDKSVQEEFEPLLPKHTEKNDKEHLESVSQGNSETCNQENLRNGVQSHPETSVKESDNDSNNDADSDSFHSAESETYMDS